MTALAGRPHYNAGNETSEREREGQHGVFRLTAVVWPHDRMRQPPGLRRPASTSLRLDRRLSGIGSQAVSVRGGRLSWRHLEMRRSAPANAPVRGHQRHAEPLQGSAQREGLRLKSSAAAVTLREMAIFIYPAGQIGGSGRAGADWGKRRRKVEGQTVFWRFDRKVVNWRAGPFFRRRFVRASAIAEAVVEISTRSSRTAASIRRRNTRSVPAIRAGQPLSAVSTVPPIETIHPLVHRKGHQFAPLTRNFDGQHFGFGLLKRDVGL